MRAAIAGCALVASASLARADVTADMRKAIDAELAWMESSPAKTALALADIKAPAVFAADATFSLPDSEVLYGGDQLWAELFAACGTPTKHDVKSFTATPSADGKSAWVSFVVTFTRADKTCRAAPVYRVSELLAEDAGKWTIVAGAWSLGVPNEDVRDEAARRNLAVAISNKTTAPADAKTALDQLVAQGLDATAAARADLVVFGSAAGERTSDGKSFAAAWKAGWVKKTRVEGSIVGRVVNGSTMWVIANLGHETKGVIGDRIAFRTFLVFDRAGSSWSLAHVHLGASITRFGIDGGTSGCGDDVRPRIRRRLFALHGIVEPVGAVGCAPGHFRIAGKIVPAMYVDLDYRGDDTHDGAGDLLSRDGWLVLQRVKPHDPHGDENDETFEAVDLDGDGADEVLVDSHASARADIQQVFVRGLDRPDTGYLRYAVDLRPKDIQGWCEGTATRERAGKQTHVVVTVTKRSGEVPTECLANGKHVFEYDAKANKLVELLAGR